MTRSASTADSRSCASTIPVAWCTTRREYPSSPSTSGFTVWEARARRSTCTAAMVDRATASRICGSVRPPGFPRVQIDRSDVQRTDRQREGVQGAYFNVTERLHEDWPSRMRGSLDVVREHRAAHPQGIPTGSFAQVELQFIDPRSSGVARAHRLCSKWAA